MDVIRPATLAEALEARATRPDAVPLSGGTDLMVDLNFDRRRPRAILDLSGVGELGEWERRDGWVRLGAAVTYTRVTSDLAGDLPGLAAASRTVGSPQIRNRGTVGGNLGTASPAGDALPPLVACGAEVEVASSRGRRTIGIGDFLVGPKRNALGPDELIVAVHAPRAAGPQQFSKIGTRNAMVIAVVGFALSLDPEGRSVGTGIGSAGPVVARATDAERWLEEVLRDGAMWETPGPLAEDVVERFGTLVADAARPIDDVRGTAAYRRHALSVLARRALVWAWSDYRGRF